MSDDLDARKSQILWAVVDDYIASAEPVGSRTLAKKYNLGISPATIRNEMADLEMLGYLEHPHTSAGRIPSSKGYRYYVDGLQPVAPVTDAEKKKIHDWYNRRVRRLDEVFQETARLIADVTHNVSLVLAPQAAQSTFRMLQFLPLDMTHAIAVLMTDAGFVENRIVEIPDGATFADFQRMAGAVNTTLSGKTLSDVTKTDMRRVRDAIGDESIFVAAVEVMHRALEGRSEDRLYLGGTAQLLGNPEFQDLERVRAMLLVLEREDLVKDILHTHAGEGLEVTIGRENANSTFWDSSFITATYHVDGRLLGTIAVLGPTRMEYAKAMRILDYVNTNLTEMIYQLEMVGEVNGLQEKEELTAEEQPVEEVTETEDAPADVTVEDVPAEEDKTAALEAELKEKGDRILRLQADFENFRRRTAKEKEELAAVITQNLLTDLLPLLDNFERAMAVEQTDVEAFQKGVEMISTQLREVMEKHGLEHIDAEGQPFDPNVHQAVMRVENPDVEDGTITQVLQKGYQAKGRVIRPAMVQVAGN